MTGATDGPRGTAIFQAIAVLAGCRTDSPVNIDLSVPIWAIEHVAAAFYLSVDAAREYTYRADFPRPRAGFSRNLWTRQEILDWFAGLPPRPRGRVGRSTSTVSTAAGARTATAARATTRPADIRPADTRRAAAPAGSRPGGRPAGAPKSYTPRQK